MAAPEVSVLVLTKNEERNIRACLQSVGFSSDVVVLDSLSTDRTAAIAESFGNVRVVSRPFDDWATHQNWAVAHLDFRHPWVLYVDADERVDGALPEELARECTVDSPYAAFRLRRKDIFMGRWLRHAQLYPTWLVRVFRPERIRYERLVNPVAVVQGPLGELNGHLLHYPFSKGIDQWIERHNSYSTLETREMLKPEGRASLAASLQAVLTRDPNARRAALKGLFYRLPARPQLKWLYYVLARGAWRDGTPGLTYARLVYLYEHMISIKLRIARTPAGDLNAIPDETQGNSGHPA